MSLSIIHIQNHGDYSQEYVGLRATAKCNGKYSLLMDTTYLADASRISNSLRHVYWFPDTEFQEGDIVLLYTRKGTNSVSLSNGTRFHHLYWGLDKAVWNNAGDAAVLMDIKSWTTTRAK